MKSVESKEVADKRLLVTFIELFCRQKHRLGEDRGELFLLEEELATSRRKPLVLCPECADLLSYAMQRRHRCPLKPKPSCKRCPVHCYSPDYRQRIRLVMAYSGRQLLLRGRLDLLWHYLF
jgi:hypothetical protein